MGRHVWTVGRREAIFKVLFFRYISLDYKCLKFIILYFEFVPFVSIIVISREIAKKIMAREGF